MLMEIYALSVHSPGSAQNSGGAGVNSEMDRVQQPGARVCVCVCVCVCVGARLLRNVRSRLRVCSRRHENEVREGRSTLQHKSRRKGEWM